jgi:Protein of unknown function (DUF2934)
MTRPNSSTAPLKPSNPYATMSPLAPEIHPHNLPSHSEIEHCARLLWLDSGSPVGRDVEIWLEAEHRLNAALHTPNVSDFITQTLCGQDRS